MRNPYIVNLPSKDHPDPGAENAAAASQAILDRAARVRQRAYQSTVTAVQNALEQEGQVQEDGRNARKVFQLVLRQHGRAASTRTRGLRARSMTRKIVARGGRRLVKSNRVVLKRADAVSLCSDAESLNAAGLEELVSLGKDRDDDEVELDISAIDEAV